MTRGDNREVSGRTAQSAHAPLWHGRPPLPPPAWRAAAPNAHRRADRRKKQQTHTTPKHTNRKHKLAFSTGPVSIFGSILTTLSFWSFFLLNLLSSWGSAAPPNCKQLVKQIIFAF